LIVETEKRESFSEQATHMPAEGLARQAGAMRADRRAACRRSDAKHVEAEDVRFV
jgi:hypothetical protein